MAMQSGGDTRAGFENAAGQSFAAANAQGTLTPLALSMSDCILKGRERGQAYGSEYAKMVRHAACGQHRS